MSFSNRLITNKHVFICLNYNTNSEINYICDNFMGIVISSIIELETFYLGSNLTNLTYYLAGDIDIVLKYDIIKYNNGTVLIIDELYYGTTIDYPVISIGEVPININNVGVYIREFNPNIPYFNNITNEHHFQNLTGVYITPIKNDEYHLLRCSSDFNSLTNNIKPTDKHLLEFMNLIASHHYELPVDFNNILTNIYQNQCIIDSDKTKNMSDNGIIAFCTFYENFIDREFPYLKSEGIRRNNKDHFDFQYNNESILTRLRFRLINHTLDLVKQFDLVLYPNSVFMMSSDMNRLYTHEIIPSSLSVEKLPVRMEYVII